MIISDAEQKVLKVSTWAVLDQDSSITGNLYQQEVKQKWTMNSSSFHLPGFLAAFSDIREKLPFLPPLERPTKLPAKASQRGSVSICLPKVTAE